MVCPVSKKLLMLHDVSLSRVEIVEFAEYDSTTKINLSTCSSNVGTKILYPLVVAVGSNYILLTVSKVPIGLYIFTSVLVDCFSPLLLSVLKRTGFSVIHHYYTTRTHFYCNLDT